MDFLKKIAKKIVEIKYLSSLTAFEGKVVVPAMNVSSQGQDRKPGIMESSEPWTLVMGL